MRPPTANPASAGAGASARRTFWWAFVGFLLLGAGWSLALPYDGPADEMQHVTRAYSLVSGEVMPRADALVTVPASLAPAGLTGDQPCLRWHLETTAACFTSPDAHAADSRTLVRTPSGAANYNPVYYALVGLPIKLWPDYTGIVIARLLTSALMAGLFAGAVAVARRISAGRGPLLVGGVLLAVTPVAVNMAGGVNPAGPEIAAGVALWAALVAVLKARDDSRWTLALLAVSACLLAVLREFGIGWLAASVVVTAFGTPRERLKELLRRRAVWLAALPVLAAVGFGAMWILLSTQGGIPSSGLKASSVPTGSALLAKELTHRVPYYTQGLVGLTSYGDIAIPFPLVAAWFAAVGTLLVQAARKCGWRVALQLTAIVGFGYAVLVAADLVAAEGGWWLSQGRYALPLLAGATVLAAYELSERRIPEAARQGRVVRGLAWVLLPTQGVALWVTMIRFQHAFRSRHPGLFDLFTQTSSINPFTGEWTPVAGALAPVLCCLAGVAALIALVLHVTRTGDVMTITGSDDTPAPTVAASVPGTRDGGEEASLRSQSVHGT
jgi:hypothetical protein